MNSKPSSSSPELHYKSSGSGTKTIVLLHYFGGNADSWNWVARRLKKNFKIISLTLPGFGCTEGFEEPTIFDYAKYINAAILELELTNYILCGHSMSAKLILYADQVMKGTKAKGLLLIAPSPPTVEKTSAEAESRMLRIPDKRLARINVENATLRQLKGQRLQTALESQLEVEDATRRWWIKTGMKNNISDRIQGVRTPTFVIYAKKDPVITKDDIYHEVLPHLYQPKIVQFSRSGHLIPLEAPRKLAKRIAKIANNIL